MNLSTHSHDDVVTSALSMLDEKTGVLDNGGLKRLHGQLKETNWGVLPYALQCCESWSHAMGVLCRYSGLFLSPEIASFHWHHVSGTLTVKVGAAYDKRAAFNWVLYQIRWIGRHLLGRRFDVHSITVPSVDGSDERRVRRLFGNIYLGKGIECQVTFLSPTLQEPPFLANAELLRYFQEKLDQQNALLASPTITEKVSDAIKAAPQPKDVSMQEIANGLRVSSRSLRRYLLSEQANFADIQKNALADVAKSLLRNANLTVEQVGDRMGYKDVRSFYRAFKGWCGITPSGYREASKISGERLS